MAETAGTAGALSPESPVTSDDIAAFVSAEAGSSPAPSEASVSPAPATEEPPASESTVSDSSPGPIPLDRHKAVLEKTRTEVRAAAEREWRQKFGWAERYQPEQVEQSSRLYQWLNADPRGFLSWLRTQIGDDGGSQAPRQAQEDTPPPPDLRAEDGTPVYSAPQLEKYLAWQERKMQKVVEPLQRQLASQQERDQLRQTAQEAKAAAGQLYRTAQTWPLFKDLEPQVLQAMKDDPRLGFQDAYIRVFTADGTAKLREQWATELQGTLAKKVDASTAPPGRPSGTPKKYAEMDVTDLVKQEFEAAARKR